MKNSNCLSFGVFLETPERKLAQKLLKTILLIPGLRFITVSMEQDTSSFKVSKKGDVGESKWSKDLLLALLERGISQEGSVLMRAVAGEGYALYGLLLGRGGHRALTVNQLGLLFMKTYKKSEEALIFKQLKD